MNIKIFLALLALFGLLIQALRADCNEEHSCDCKASGHTFFSIRPIFQVNSPEYLVHNRDFYQECPEGWQGTVQAIILGGKSNHDDGIARFFLPQCATTLRVNEQQQPGTNVLARHLNIYTNNGTFQSTVEFKPMHSYIALGINYQQKIYERSNGHSIWFTISGPLVCVNNRIDLVETIINDGGGAVITAPLLPASGGCPAACPNSCNQNCLLDPAQVLPPVDSVVAAFKQPGWCFGRIDNVQRHKTAVGDITIRIGYETVKRDDHHLDSFFGIVIPTGNTPRAITVFEPIVGHNHHWGFVLGSTFGLQVWQNACWDITVSSEFDFMITDFFARRERRSFDLKNKPWSRYMQFYKDKNQAELAAASSDPMYALALHTPGIDILTQDLKIKPGYYRTFNAGFIIEHACLELEVGYNFFARQSECLHLDCEFPSDVALKAITVGGGTTDRYQTINNDFSSNCIATPVADYENNIITVADIDLESAAQPATLTHTVFGSLAYHFDACDEYPMYVAVGGSYEFPPDNVGLNRWMAWTKYGIAF
jgi:hypothetical protein